jgi:hypothetical protein
LALLPVLKAETLKLARASASIDGHPFFAEYVTNTFSVRGYIRTSGSEAISHVAFDREHSIDVAHDVPLSAKPLAYGLTAVLGCNTTRFRDVSIGRPSSHWD